LSAGLRVEAQLPCVNRHGLNERLHPKASLELLSKRASSKSGVHYFGLPGGGFRRYKHLHALAFIGLAPGEQRLGLYHRRNTAALQHWEDSAMKYSLFTHGNALQIETPNALAGNIKVGWGTQITFREPVEENVSGVPVFAIEGPGSWFHIPLPSTLTTFGRRNPRLESVTLLFEAVHCRILHVHVYDGADIVEEFNDLKLPKTFKLAGDFLHARDSQDINPEASSPTPQTFRNTLRLKKSHRVFSAIGISFYACAFKEDFDEGGFARDHGPFPESILTISAAGGQFIAEDFSLLASAVAVLERAFSRNREP